MLLINFCFELFLVIPEIKHNLFSPQLQNIKQYNTLSQNLIKKQYQTNNNKQIKQGSNKGQQKIQKHAKTTPKNKH